MCDTYKIDQMDCFICIEISKKYENTLDKVEKYI